MNNLIAFFVRKGIFVNLLTLFVVGVGAMSLLLIRREVFPNVSFDIVSITTLAPGASAEEVEKLVTNPIEQDMQEVDGIKKLQSWTTEGRSFILAQLDPDQTNEVQGKQDIKDVVDRVQLPAFAEEPDVVALQSKQTPIITISLAGDVPPFELRTRAKELEKKLEAIDGVARVVHQGLRDQEVRVEADPRKLSRYRLSLDDLVNALARQNVTISGGTLEAPEANPDAKERIVRTVGEFVSLDDVKNTVIRANETAVPIRVADVATVYYDLAKATTLTRTNGTPSQSLTVLKKEKADAIVLVDEVRRVTGETVATFGDKIRASFINDMSQFIRRRLKVLTGNLLLGLVLVLILLGITLRPRVSAIVSLGIPFAFFGTMITFYNNGYSLNLISLLGLIIVSGMLVDDAIVVTDNCVRLIEEGRSPKDAAIEGAQQIWPAVTASVLTTIVAFLPMMFMSGIFGKFVKEIPLGVIAALLISLLEGFFILPSHVAAWAVGRTPKNPKPRSGPTFGERFWGEWVIPLYSRILKVAVERRYLWTFGAVLAFVGSLALAGKGMRFILFPPDGIETFFLRIDAPGGTSLAQTERLVQPLEKLVATLPETELKDFVTTVGLQQQDPNDPETRRGTEFAQIAVHLTPPDGRSRTVQQIIDQLRDPASQVEGLSAVSFQLQRTGPPVGKPISLGLSSDEYETILPAVTELKEILKTQKGVSDINDSYTPGKEEILVKVDGSEAAAAGLSVAQVGSTVRAAFNGLEASSIRGLDEEVKVRVSLPQSARSEADTLTNILIPNPFNQLIPLDRIARFEKGRSLALYEHEANERVIRVFAEVDAAVTSSVQANQALVPVLKELGTKHPKVRFRFSGEDKDTAESMQSLFRAFGVAALGVFLILVFTFHNILQPMLILGTIPLGIMAVILTLFLHGRPLSFMSMLGVVALVGVIVNNAIIFIDFINLARREGKDRFTSIFDAARMRVRPILLTTVTTVCGLLPTAYGIGGRDDFVVPIALSLGWGLFFGSFLTAVCLPPAVAILDDIEEWTGRWFGARIPSDQPA